MKMKDKKKKDHKMMAKRKALESLMGGGDMQKVSVMAKDKKGLEAGLEKAKELLKKKKMGY